MFDIGLGEFLFLGVLALLVFGPDRLPSAASSAGKFVARARQSLGDAKAQITESADLGSVGDDLKSLADLHPKRMLSSLADQTEPAPAAKPKPQAQEPGSSAVDPNAT